MAAAAAAGVVQRMEACQADRSPWAGAPCLQPVRREAQAHRIHTYFNVSPESPDGRFVLYFVSEDPAAACGALAVTDRRDGSERIIAEAVRVEDAHRVALQQWTCNGTHVVFRNLREKAVGGAVVETVALATGERRIVAEGWDLGIGSPALDSVPLHALHWAPGGNDSLVWLHVPSGRIRPAFEVDAIRAAFPDWVEQTFGDRPTAIVFTVLSPDGQRAFGKLGTPLSGRMGTPTASQRKGLIGLDLQKGGPLFLKPDWGHPAWLPDNRTILNVRNVLLDTDTGRSRTIPGLPVFRGNHPAPDPTGRFFLSETYLDDRAEQWALHVADLTGRGYQRLLLYDVQGGATSWRRPHAHAVFSPDGARIYLNLNRGPWTGLHVMSAGG